MPEWAILVGNPAYRRLISPAALSDYLQDGYPRPSLEALVASELVVRNWLVRGRYTVFMQGGLNAYGIDSDQQESLVEWCDSQASNRTFDLPRELSNATGDFWAMIRQDLVSWRTCHGFIVFLPPQREDGGCELASDGVALPFVSDASANIHTECIRTATDEAIIDDDLSLAVKHARGLACTAGWLKSSEAFLAVKLLTIKHADSLPITGQSAGLAVLLALALRSMNKKEGDPFKWGASGVLHLNGELAACVHDPDELIRKEKLLFSMGIQHRLLPTGPDYVEEGTLSLPYYRLAVALQGHLVDKEGAPSPTASGGTRSLMEMETLIASIQRGMREGSVSGTEAKKVCEEIIASVGESTSVRAMDLRILAMANLASAECHMGNPGRSIAICREIARDQICSDRVLAQSLVRQVVNFTDMGLYDEAVRTARDATRLLPSLSTATERLDMELQLTGSRGQALCHWALIESDKRDEAIEVLQESCRLAAKLDGEDIIPGYLELPRNRCYYYLAHALLKPVEAECVFEDAMDICLGDKVTADYLLRARWLSAYRFHLLGLPLPASLSKLDMQMPSVAAAGGWPYKTSAKYRGALRAATGDIDGACRDFEDASSLADAGGYSPLLEIIGATACLQAGKSLQEQHPDLATEYLRKAEDIFKKRGDWFSGPIKASLWLAYTQAQYKEKPSPAPTNPQLLYPY